jgi:hypothetical protein
MNDVMSADSVGKKKLKNQQSEILNGRINKNE